MSAGAVNGLTSEKIYDPTLYETAAQGSTCTKPDISTESTNVIMHILGERVIGPLSRIPDLAQQVQKGVIDQGTAQKVEVIFRSMGFVPSTAKGQPLSDEQRDLALRTANLFQSGYSIFSTDPFKKHMGILSLYLYRTRNFSKEDAFRGIIGIATSGSLSATIGERALDVFKADLLVQRARQAAAKERQVKAEGDLATAKGDLATQKTRLAAARDFIEARDRFMIRVLLRLGEEIESGKTR